MSWLSCACFLRSMMFWCACCSHVHRNRLLFSTGPPWPGNLTLPLSLPFAGAAGALSARGRSALAPIACWGSSTLGARYIVFSSVIGAKYKLALRAE